MPNSYLHVSHLSIKILTFFHILFSHIASHYQWEEKLEMRYLSV